MPTQLAKLSDLKFQPGDIVAFCGHGLFSDVIEKFTDSPVSHVAVMFDSLGTMMESTSLDSGYVDGSKIRPLSGKVQDYHGLVWYLPLRADLRAKFDHDAFYRACTCHDGLPYDGEGVVAFEFHDLKSDPRKVFCSKLNVILLQAAGVLPASIDPASVSPAAMVQMAIYEPIAYQIAGDLRDIPGFNSKEVLALGGAA